MSDRINKTTSYNKTDELDFKLLKHAEKINPLTGKPRNYSKYVKKLIEQDLINEEKGNARIIQTETVTEEKDEFTKEAMKGFF